MKQKLSLLIGFTVFISGNMYGSVLQISTGPGATSAAGNPIDIVATITTETDTIDVQLQNLLSDPLAIDQVITGVSFNLTGYNANTVSIFSIAGQLIQTPVKGAAPKNDNTDAINNWGVSASNPDSSTTAIDLTAFIGSGAPKDGIIGNPGLNSLYNNVNASITNGHAAPFLLSSADFTLTLPGVTADTNINSVMFTLGTSKTDLVTSRTSTATPEPDTWWMFGSGCVLLGFGAWRRGASKANA